MGTLNYDRVAYRYASATRDALVAIDLHIGAGEFVVIAGPSGSGKSTLLRAANGIVPHLTGGTFSGTVTVADRSTRDHEPRKLADVVGFVHQDPEAQFVVDHVESDIAFVLENLGHPAVAMRRRVEEVLDALAIAHLRDRDASTLSGGERQRVAIAGAIAASPSVLVLDEPTSQLDPQGADDVLGALTRLNNEFGTTIFVAEHRLERAAPLAERAIIVREGSITHDGDPARVLRDYEGAPTVTQLGRELGWYPPPLTVKAAMAFARALDTPPPFSHALPARSVIGPTALTADRLNVRYGDRDALRQVDFEIREGEIVALLGRNGSGKSTLLRTLSGLQRSRGSVSTPHRVAYVPQEPGSLFSAPTVREEILETLRLLNRRHETDQADTWIERLSLSALVDRHPRSLSGGERQRLAIAVVVVGGAPILLLDEPTRGMDAPSRKALEHAIVAHASSGGAVVLATHDVELAARVAMRVVVMGDGEIVADGEASTVLAGSLFAPQVLRVLPPLLTVADAKRWFES